MRALKTRRSVTNFASGAAVLVAASLLLGGCTSSTPPKDDPTDASTPAVSETPTPTPAAVAKAPLTGLPLAAGAGANASIASKIDNQFLARPQVGLQYTDLVFEELVEGGLTRYVAVWQSNIPKLYGPVRSIRGMDPAIVSPFGGIITYSGGQPIFVDGIKKTDVINVSHDMYSGDPDIFYRTKEKKAPHNVIAKGENIIKKFGEGVAAPAQQFEYSDDLATSTAVVSGTPTSKIKPVFSDASKPTWDWNAEKSVWLRTQDNGKIDVDNDGNQLQAVNVVTMRVKLKTISHTPVSQLVGSNKATVSSGGKTVEGTWTKDALTDKITLTDAAGAPIALAPGNTWIELVASGGSVTTVE